jgi:hypothetical protein
MSIARPITVVSGPEIMDKFVGSSEMKLREVFDKPPDIYEHVRTQEADHGDALAKAVSRLSVTTLAMNLVLIYCALHSGASRHR